MERKLFCDGWTFGESGKEKRNISLPHDAMQWKGRQADAPSGSAGAFFLGGIYEYEKEIWGNKEWEGKEILLEFEGIYPNADVYLNGKRIGNCQYGYTQFRVSLDGLKYGQPNELKIIVDNSVQPNSRWYSGAGIYRPVWLLTGNKEHIEPHGIRITTMSCKPAEIRVDVAHTMKCKDYDKSILTEIFYKGKKVAEETGEHSQIRIPDAHLWDAETPELYECVVTLKDAETVVDTQKTIFGIRKIEWSSDGLLINGKNVLLKGGCIHHDNGILGARSFEESEWRRIRKLKENGYNAVRSSHNPLCRAALEACDALGVYVMDETWDMWNKAKNSGDYAQHFMENYKTDLISIVEKDYNHPSVIMYSVGNEVTEPAKPEGVELAKEIVSKLKTMDSSRPVTAGINLTLLMLATMEKNPLESGEAPNVGSMNSTVYNQMVTEMGNNMTMAAATEPADQISSPVFEVLDIAGYNYATSRYESEGEIHPERIVVGSETYTYELPKTWKLVEKYPYIIGDFMWTAWDYLGEAGIGSWTYDMASVGFNKTYPWLLADTGAFDILGNETAAAGMAAIVWKARKLPYIAVKPANHPKIAPARAIWRGTNALPYWSYQGCEGNETEVEVYSTAYEAELLINGRSVGRKKLSDCKAEFCVPYEPGELKAVVYREDGMLYSQNSLFSADEQTEICIVPEKDSVNIEDILYLDISLRGRNGEIECNRDTKLKVSVSGGELLAYGSANPQTEEDFLAGEYTTYYGRSQAVVKVLAEELFVRAEGEGMEPAALHIRGKERKTMTIKKELFDVNNVPEYQKPYIDEEEERERMSEDGIVYPFYYVHGGFEGTNVKFSFCFPPKEKFRGRFYQYLSPFPGPDEENASLGHTGKNDRILFCLKNGAYYVESNMGSRSVFEQTEDPTIVYKSSAAVAEYSRIRAMEFYGCDRPYGYVFGGSGGGYKTMACIENTTAWDGAVPYVIGSPASLPNTITLHVQGQRCLRRVFRQIVDAVDAGGSKDMYAGLTKDEEAMLREITGMGFPPEAWFLEANGLTDDGSLPVLAPLIKKADPGYFKDFWEVPGYMGADPKSNAVRDRLRFSGIVKRVHMPGAVMEKEDTDGRNGVDDAWKKMLADGKDGWVELEEVPQGELYLKGVSIHFISGDAEGKVLSLGQIKDNCLIIGMCYGMDDIGEVLSVVKPGDKVFLDNSDYIAFQSYYRHRVPEDKSFHAWDQFRDTEGKSKLPQRPDVLGTRMTGTGTVQDGNIQGKVIVIQALMDESTCPWCGDWYRNKVAETKGTDADIRLYYMERCLHGDICELESNRIVNYMGALRQALLDISDWVERGIEPPVSTAYEYRDGQILVKETAGERKGVQPTVTLLANGQECTRVKSGETVRFTVRAEVPEGTGRITAVRYDVEEISALPSDRVFRNTVEFEETKDGNVFGARAEFEHVYETPGTYMASVRVQSNRDGNRKDIFTQIKNLARVRVIVE